MKPQSRRDFFCTSAALAAATATSPLLLAEEKAKPLTVLFFGAELPEVKKDLQAVYSLKALSAGVKKDAKPKEDNIAGLEQLENADLWIGSIAKRTHPSDEQLAHVKKHLAAGKPFVGYRAASHVFENWLRADQAIFGAKYGGHHLLEKDPVMVIEVAKGQAEHAILKGIEVPRPSSGSYFYTELSPDVTVLLYSGIKGDMMPHTWVRENKETKGRVFYTRYDAKELATNEVVRKIFLRGIAWTLKLSKS